MATELPSNFEQLVQRSAIPAEDQSVRCNICLDPYNTEPKKERAIVLPGCKHIFGEYCIREMLNTDRNRCPLCRKRVLDPDTEEEMRRHLAAWTPGQVDPPGQGDPSRESIPMSFARQGAYLFGDLCYAITRTIESVRMDSTQLRWVVAREWLVWARYQQIIGLGTFEEFANVVNGPRGAMRDIIYGLGEHPEPPEVLFALLAHARRVPEYRRSGGEFPAANAQTYEMVAWYYGRISRSRDSLYVTLYGMT
ncbi:MAG: hypothetical protein LQ352_006827 [Teloschistes flavicans]|nr:MAG: hypothetical protein LQ352_006827 [Teloschistes flavicans]